MTTQQRISKIERAIIKTNPKNYDALREIVMPLTPKNWGWAPHWAADDRIYQINFYPTCNELKKVVIPETINCKISTTL